LLIGRPDQVLKGQTFDVLGGGGIVAKETPQDSVTEFIGELEPLYEAIPQLIVRWRTQMPRQTLAKAIDGIDQRG
jgi:hypothetical protein